MKIYRIYTEHLNKNKIIAICNQALSTGGYTIYETTGYWKGQEEISLVIEHISCLPFAPERMKDIAQQIKDVNNQQTVLLTCQDMNYVMEI